jgi:hypothetical protein
VNELYKDKLEILRQRIPIGLRHGLTLLEKTDGDLEKAQKKFQEEMIALTVNKTGITSDLATTHLVKNHFDIGLTLKSIDEERFTLTERILRLHKVRKEDALNNIMLAVEEKYSLKRNFWLVFDNLKNLPTETYCLMTIMAWLNYEDYESFDSAINFHLDIIAEQIEKNLLLPQIATTLKQAKLIYEDQYEAQQKLFKTNGGLGQTPEMEKLNNQYDLQRPLLIDTLYNYTHTHIDKFP